MSENPARCDLYRLTARYDKSGIEIVLHDGLPIVLADQFRAALLRANPARRVIMEKVATSSEQIDCVNGIGDEVTG